MAILVQRRGVMYDPLVVDTFAACWPKLSSELTVELEPAQPAPSRRTLATPVSIPRLEQPVRPDLADPLGRLAETAIQKTGAEVAVIFAADRDTDRLVSLVARTPSGAANESFSIPLGYGVSGWVAVNATPLLNADAGLDFQQSAPHPGLVRSICVPVLIHGESVGAFSVYTSDPRGFSEEDKAVVLELAASCSGGDAFSAVNVFQASRKASIDSSPTVH
jgi:signal transduction protein with GAF and PtsI domain